MANKKVSQLVSKPSVLVTDLFPIADPTTGQLFKTTISDLGTAIGSGVSSVNTLVGAVVLDTDDIQELASPTNRWFTDTRSRAAISGGTGISYNSGTGVITNAVTSGLIATALGYTPADGANYLALAGGTMGGAITGTIATFASSSSVTALGITLSGASGDGVKITHSAGRAFNIQSSGSGFGILINNETASTSAPFTIQKQGLAVISMTDAGAGSFASSLTANSFIKSSGTSSQFLKADGSVDSSVYALDNTVVKLTGNQSVAGIKTFTSGVSAELLWIKEGAGFANPAGYAQLATDITYFHFNNSNNTAFARFLYGSGQRIYTLPSSDGTIALTSNLSSYLPVSGGTLTGAVTGTRLTLVQNSADIALSIVQTGAGSGLSVLGKSYFSTDIQLGYATNSILKTTALGFITSAIAGTDYVIPSALSSYLPLSGGTLTGALSGTSATFSGNVGVGTNSTSVTLQVGNGSGVRQVLIDGGGYNLVLGTSGGGLFGFASQAIAGIFNTSATPLGIGTNSAQDLILGTSNIARVTIAASTGAATFSSSVTATKIGIGTSFIPASRRLSVAGSADFTNAPGEGANFSIVPAANGQDGVVLNVGYDTGVDYGSLFINTGGNTSMIINKNGAVTFSNTVTLPNNTYLQFNNSSGTARTILTVDASNTTVLRHAASGGAFALQNFANTQNNLLITDAGAATFSSSVTANTGAYGAVGGFVINYSGASTSSRSWRMITEQAVFGDFDIQQSTTQTGSTYASRMYFSPSGNVGIGTTAPSSLFEINRSTNSGSGATFPRINIVNSLATQGDGSSTFNFADIRLSAGNDAVQMFMSTTFAAGTWAPAGIINVATNHDLQFKTNNAERMRITSGGYLKASNNGTYLDATGSYHELRTNLEEWTTRVSNSNASPYGLIIKYSGASPNNTSNFFFVCSDSTTDRLRIQANGNVVNTNNSYGAISDISLKENITDSSSKLTDLLKVKIKNYNLIGDSEKQIGVIAQELEEVFPKMVEIGENGLKSVKYSVFVPMLIKAVQELSDKITTLENK